MAQSLVKVTQKKQHIIVKNAGGLRGLTGAKGDKGDPGSAATVSVGETTTLPAGSNAVVANGGTSSATILNFGIPKGDKGDKGDAGAGLQITGSVDTYSQLPNDLTEEDAGKAYFVQADGKLYVWSGSAFPADGEGTQFKGDTGATGPAGFSPIAVVAQEDDGATISITDSGGTTTARVYNGVSPEVDSALSNSSVNPVQNKVITAALNEKQPLIGDEDITVTMLAPDSVGAAKIQNGAVTGAANSDTTVDESDSKIGLATIGTPNIRDGAITSAKIGEGEVKSHNIDFATFMRSGDVNIGALSAGAAKGLSVRWSEPLPSADYAVTTSYRGTGSDIGNWPYVRALVRNKTAYGFDLLAFNAGTSAAGGEINVSYLAIAA